MTEIYKAVGPFPVHSPEWHEHRRTCIGASEIAAILGVEGAYGTPLQVWASKVEPEEKGDEGAEWLHFGNVLEPIIAEEFERRSGHLTEDVEEQFVSVAYPWLGASLDKWFWKEGVLNPLELKNTGSFMKHRWEEGVWLPYQVQVQGQMAVTGTDLAAVAVLIGGNEFKWAYVERNQRFIDAMMEKLERFWEMVVRHEMPDPVAADTKIIGGLLGEENAGTSVALTGDWIDYDERLVEIKAEIKELDLEKDKIEAKLKKAIGTNERGVLPGGGQYTFKTVERKGFTVQPSKSRQLRRIKGGKNG